MELKKKKQKRKENEMEGKGAVGEEVTGRNVYREIVHSQTRCSKRMTRARKD